MTVAMTVAWKGVEDLPVYTANQFIAQVQGVGSSPPDDILLTGGHVAPPVFLGVDAEQQAVDFASSNKTVPVNTLFRISMTRARTLELIALLGSAVEQYDQQQVGDLNGK